MPHNSTSHDDLAYQVITETIRHEFAEHWAALRDKLIQIGHKYGLDTDECEDAVQDTWSSIDKNPGDLLAVTNPRAWIISTHSLKCLDKAGRKKRRKHTSIDAIDAGNSEPESNSTVALDSMLLHRGEHAGPRTSADYNLSECNDLLWDSLSVLTQEQRMAVILRVLGSEPYTKVASLIGCTPANARIHFHRAVPKLQNFITSNRNRYE